MTIKHLRELLDKVVNKGVDENQQIYLETYRNNESDEIIIAKAEDGETIVYISDSEPDDLIEYLAEDGYTVEELY